MNTLPASVQEQVREYDKFVRTYFITENTLIRVYEITPTGEEVVSYIQRITQPPSMGFIEFVEKEFMPKTPFTKKLFILREGSFSCKKPWICGQGRLSLLSYWRGESDRTRQQPEGGRNCRW